MESRNTFLFFSNNNLDNNKEINSNDNNRINEIITAETLNSKQQNKVHIEKQKKEKNKFSLFNLQEKNRIRNKMPKATKNEDNAIFL